MDNPLPIPPRLLVDSQDNFFAASLMNSLYVFSLVAINLKNDTCRPTGILKNFLTTVKSHMDAVKSSLVSAGVFSYMNDGSCGIVIFNLYPYIWCLGDQRSVQECLPMEVSKVVQKECSLV